MLIDEIIPHVYQYLEGNPGAPEHGEFSHVLIDDDDQSIYSFKHAHPDGIRQWHTRNPTDDHAIAECRRCPTTVVRMANAQIARNADRIAGRVLTERPANGPGQVVVRQYRTATAEADAVADKIAALVAGGVAPSEIIALAQRDTFGTPIFERLRARGIPTKSYYAETELDTLGTQERFALLKLLLNKDDRVALRWLLGRGHTSWRAPYDATEVCYIPQEARPFPTVVQRRPRDLLT